MLRPKWSGRYVWLPDILSWLPQIHKFIEYKTVIPIIPITGGICTVEITKNYVKIPIHALIYK